MSGMWLIGVDEAGRGPVLGPLVVSAFALPKDDVSLLVEAGVKDSKQLSPVKRDELFDWISTTAVERGWQYQVHKSSPASIDIAMSLETLNEHEVALFAHCVKRLQCQQSGGVLQLDACDVNAKRFGIKVGQKLRHWLDLGEWEIDSRHGADVLFPAVAAASIIAKVERDRAIEEIELEIGFPIGSGYTSDTTTKQALAKLLEGHRPHSQLRWRWETVKSAWSELGKGEVPTRQSGDGGEPKPSQQTLW